MLTLHSFPHMELEHRSKEKPRTKDPPHPHSSQPVSETTNSISISSTQNESSRPKISTPSPSPIKEEMETTGYDSDCLVIVECDPADCHLSPGDGQDMSQSSTGCGMTSVDGESRGKDYSFTPSNNNIGERKLPKDEPLLSPPNPNYSHYKLHNLPIHELKKKLAYCPVCDVQWPNHKVANLCLNKHGMRQCWLCLEVISNTKDSYFQHCVSNHAVRPSSDMVACPYCQKFFDFRQGINQHIVKVHFSEDTSFFNTTACLSPGSLVDIYTGQSRSNSNGSSSGCAVNDHFQEEVCHPINLNRSDGNDSIVLEEIKVIRSAQEGVGGTVSQLSTLRRPPTRAATRESVIRETPSWCETISDKRSSYMQNPSFERESHLNSDRRPQSHPQPGHTPKQQVSISVVGVGESSLPLPQRPSSDPIQPSLYISLFNSHAPKAQPHDVGYYYNTPSSFLALSPAHQSHTVKSKKHFHPHPTSNKINFRETSLHDFHKMLSEDFDEAKVTTEYLNSVKSMLKTVADYGPQDPIENDSGQIHHHSDSLSFHTNDGGGTDASRLADMSHELRSFNEDNNFKVPTHAGVKRRILTKWDEHQEKKCEPGSSTQPMSYFGENIFPPHSSSTFNNETKYEPGNYHHQPFSLEGSLRAPGGLHDMAPEDQQFWEQVLRESGEMYKSPQTQESYQRQYQELQYRVALHQQSQDNRPPYYSNSCVQQHQLKSGGESSYLPHVLTRGGESSNVGRQYGYNNENPCHASASLLQENNTPAGGPIPSSQLVVYNPGQTHKQYEYRIIPQSTSIGNGGTIVPNYANAISNLPQDAPAMNTMSSTPTISNPNNSSSFNKQPQYFTGSYPPQTQSDLPPSRKRKSLFPNRVVQQLQIVPGDSVVVQNPFEEEEVTFHSKLRQPVNNNHIPLSTSSNITRKSKHASSPTLACQRVSSSNTNSSTALTPHHPRQAQYDAVQIHHQQLLQHQQNVQIQINHHHHHPPPSRFTNATPKLQSPAEYHYQQQLSRIKGHRLGNGDNRIGSSMLPPPVVTSGPRNFQYDVRSNGTPMRSSLKANGNRETNHNVWPFAIAPRYQERCRSIAFHVKEMEMQQKLREKCKRNLISSAVEGENRHHTAIWQ